jgi:diacylglycerol kinase family enzyme
MKPNLVLIVNQYAGKNQHNRDTPVIGTWKRIGHHVLHKLGKHFEIDVSTPSFGAHHFIKIVKEKAVEYAHQQTIFAFVGGDDSFDYGITELVKQKRKLNDLMYKVAYIPAGEGMAVKYAFGIRNLEHALNMIIEQESEKVDLLNINDERLGLYCGQGLFGMAVCEREKTNVHGVKGYIIPGIKAYFSSLVKKFKRKTKLTTKTAVKNVDQESIGILFSKIMNIGGGLPLVPKAKLNDGLIHVVSYGPFGPIYEDAAENIFSNYDHTHYGGDYQGIKPLNIIVEKQAIDMILNKPELLRRKTLIA